MKTGSDKPRRGRPRVPLNELLAEWRTGDQRTRTSIEANWARSSRAFLRALLAEHPDGIHSITASIETERRYSEELFAWNRQPFGDGNPHGWPKEEVEERQSQRNWKVFNDMLQLGAAKYSDGSTPETNIEFWGNRTRFHFCYAYRAAWRLRNAEESDRGKPMTFNGYPNRHWTVEDYHLTLIEQAIMEINRAANAEAFAIIGVPFTPLETYPLIIDYYEGVLALPDPEPGHPPLSLPRNEKGEVRMPRHSLRGAGMAPTLKRLYDNQKDRAAFFQGPNWTIMSRDHIHTTSPRESWRPILEGTSQEHLLEIFSDEIIVYFDDPDYGKPGHDHTIKERKLTADMRRYDEAEARKAAAEKQEAKAHPAPQQGPGQTPGAEG